MLYVIEILKQKSREWTGIQICGMYFFEAVTDGEAKRIFVNRVMDEKGLAHFRLRRLGSSDNIVCGMEIR
jgi:hypothetical protein